MKKGTLIGYSIIAAVLLVLVCFPSVVGYHQMKSATIQKSKTLKSVQNCMTLVQSLLGMKKKMHPTPVGSDFLVLLISILFLIMGIVWFISIIGIG